MSLLKKANIFVDLSVRWTCYYANDKNDICISIGDETMCKHAPCTIPALDTNRWWIPAVHVSRHLKDRSYVVRLWGTMDLQNLNLRMYSPFFALGRRHSWPRQRPLNYVLPRRKKHWTVYCLVFWFWFCFYFRFHWYDCCRATVVCLQIVVSAHVHTYDQRSYIQLHKNSMDSSLSFSLSRTFHLFQIILLDSFGLIKCLFSFRCSWKIITKTDFGLQSREQRLWYSSSRYCFLYVEICWPTDIFVTHQCTWYIDSVQRRRRTLMLCPQTNLSHYQYLVRVRSSDQTEWIPYNLVAGKWLPNALILVALRYVYVFNSEKFQTRIHP